MMFRALFWVVLPCKVIVDNHFTRQYNPEDSSEHNLTQFFGRCLLLTVVIGLWWSRSNSSVMSFIYGATAIMIIAVEEGRLVSIAFKQFIALHLCDPYV
jgi:hypothetical protein